MEPTSHAGPLEVYRSVVWPVYEHRRTAQRSVDDGLDRHGPTPAVSSHNRRNPRFVAKSPTHRSDETSASSLTKEKQTICGTPGDSSLL